MTVEIDPEAMRRLLVHEAQVHAVPGRRLRDLGDSVLLTDPIDPEPFWNRLAAVRWPTEADAFDRRLTEILVLFATLARQPHIWPAPIHDSPGDLIARLTANGFQDMGPGTIMVLANPSALRPTRQAGGWPPGVTVERCAGLHGQPADERAQSIVEVLADAFGVVPDRIPAVQAETRASVGHPWFTHYLVRYKGQPAAVARRATFHNRSYLSSIGTAGWARGRGYGRIATSAAARDSLGAASEWTYLGVFADNDPAIRLYDGLGFERIGDASPDLLLV
jgi:hypothetical protein